MARNDFISFDASVKDGKLGIGIYDNLTFKHFTYYTTIDKDCSFKGEQIALGCALKYAHKIKRTKLNLYTDNQAVANHGIPKQFQHLVEGKVVKLTWIPREFNKEADKASKGKTDPVNVQADKIIKNSTRKALLQHPFDEKIKLLKRISDDTTEHNEIIRLIKERVKGDYKFQLHSRNPSLTALVKLVYTIFDQNELSHYANKRLRSSFKNSGIKLQALSPRQLKALVRP